MTLGTTPARRQRGTALISALVAFLVISVGLLTVTRSQLQLRQSSDLSRQRSEAQRLAQADVERLRAFPALDGAAGWDAIADATLDATPDGSQTSYTLSRSVSSVGDAGYKAVRAAVSWNDARGMAHQVRLATVIARHDPAYDGALTQPHHGRPVATVRGRDARVPLAATDLGDGRSVLKLSETATRAVVFDNADGAVTGLCTVAADRRGGDLVAGDLSACAERRGALVVGHVRFALGAAPSAADANDRPLPFAVALPGADASAAAPVCAGDADVADAQGERWAAYACLVTSAGDAPAVPGRAVLVPAGWVLGGGAGQYRVCRYGAGGGDAPPAARQNFLVVAGMQACPAGTSDGA